MSHFLLYRENVEALIKDINRQKDAIKKTGIAVDGKCFKVKFTGYLCLPILTLYIFLPYDYFFFAMLLCYMSSHVIVLLNLFYAWQC